MADLTYTLVIFAVILLNLIILLMKKPILSLVVGLVTISIVASAIVNDVEVVFSPYPQLMLLLVAVVCMLLSVAGARD